MIDEQNPDVQLIMRCPNLRNVGFTFHAEKMTMKDPENTWDRVHRPLEAVIEYYQLRPMLECKRLKHIYFEGILPRYSSSYPSQPLKTLEDLGNWLVDAFEEKGREVGGVEVEYHERNGYYVGRRKGRMLKGFKAPKVRGFLLHSLGSLLKGGRPKKRHVLRPPKSSRPRLRLSTATTSSTIRLLLAITRTTSTGAPTRMTTTGRGGVQSGIPSIAAGMMCRGLDSSRYSAAGTSMD